MDNWRETMFVDNKYTKPFHYLLNRTVKKIEKRMKKGLVISEKMGHEYNKKYKVDYVAIMNSVDTTVNIGDVSYDNKKEIIFTYAGGLHLGRYMQLLEIQNRIADFNNKSSGVNISLVIYTSKSNQDNYQKLFENSITKFKDYLPHEQVSEIYEEADVLVHIESFDKKTIEYTKYSMSTKIPEYMASGKPILCYAPENIAVYEYINYTKTGICVSNDHALLAAVTSLATESEKRKLFGENGILTANKNHKKKRSDDILKEVLSYSVKC